MIKQDILSDSNFHEFGSPIIRYDMELNEIHPFRVRNHTFKNNNRLTYDMHYALELGIILEGKVRRFYARDYAQDYEAGQIWLSGIWDPHGWQVIQAPYQSVFMHILPETVSGMQFCEALHINFMSPFLADPQDRPVIPENKYIQIKELGHKLLHIQNQKNDSQQLWYRHIFQEILMIVYEIWRPPFSSQRNSSNFFSKIHPAINLVFGDRRFISETEASRVCNMSTSSFHKLFKKITGITFADFSLRYRIGGISIDLATTSKTVKEIGYDWGFRYIGNMDRSFKKFYGCSPCDYRIQKLSSH